MALKQNLIRSKRTALHPDALTSFRGPAWIDGGDIVMDRKRATKYNPTREPKVGLELTKVRTPQDAVKFVELYGLPNIDDDAIWLPDEVRQPFREIEKLASRLRSIVEDAVDVRAGVNGDAAAVERLRSRLLERMFPGGKVPKRLAASAAYIRRELVSDRRVLLEASEGIATELEFGLQGAFPVIMDRAFQGEPIEPGRLRISLCPKNLAGFCFLTFALALAEKEPLGVCPECGSAFVIEDGRQKFCSPQCAARTRFKRFKANEATKRKGGRSAKKTRER